MLKTAVVHATSRPVLPRGFLYLQDALTGKVPIGPATQYHRLVGPNMIGVELAENNPVGATPMHMAALTGSIPALQYCLECGYDFHDSDRAGITPNDLLLILREPKVMQWMYQNKHLPVMPTTLSEELPSEEERIEQSMKDTKYMLYSLKYPYGHGSPMREHMKQLYYYPLYERLQQQDQDLAYQPRHRWLRQIHNTLRF